MNLDVDISVQNTMEATVVMNEITDFIKMWSGEHRVHIDIHIKG